MPKAKNEWVKDGLMKRGYRQKDLAVAWATQEASVSRFIGGVELQDLPLSKATTLARMLDITLEELARGLGITGTPIEPSIKAAGEGGHPVPLGTVSMTTVTPGVVRLEIRKDVSVPAAQEVIRVLGSDVIPA